MRDRFGDFLNTIFYKLDPAKVFSAMGEILRQTGQSNSQIYTQLLSRVEHMKKRFSLVYELFSLHVLKQGMGRQAAEHLQVFQTEKFHDYMEIYFRRYCDVLRKIANLPLDGQVIAVTDTEDVHLVDRIQAGALFSRYPYQTHVPLNDLDCQNPLAEPQKTHKPLGDEVADQSIDLIAVLGGFHHIPKERLEPFIASLHQKLRPGAVLLLRDHNVITEEEKALVSVVHSFVNAANGVSEQVESREVREFKTSAQWIEVMKKYGFLPVSSKNLILKDDPTQNRMMAFVRAPANLNELHQACAYRKDGKRPQDGTNATWIEWGNVRFSKQYAEFIEHHHAFAFDYLGHIRQHAEYFLHYVQKSLDEGVSLKNLLLSDNMAMNLFILSTTAMQNVCQLALHLPSMALARWRAGANWRDGSDLTDLEQFEAQIEQEYSRFIDHTPFYQFDYLGKISSLWQVVAKEQGSWGSKLSSAVSASFSTLGLLAKAAVSAPIRALYTSDSYVEPDTVNLLIHDPENELPSIIQRWETSKNPVHEKQLQIKVVYSTPDGYKWVSLPRYRPFTQIYGYLADTQKLQVLEVGGQPFISVDVRLDARERIPEIAEARLVYEMPKLQDAENRRYATYKLSVQALQGFVRTIGQSKIEYIHE